MSEAVKAAKTCGLAVWSLVLGILSLTCFGMVSGIPAVVCGHLAQSRIKQSEGELDGGGLAIGGLVTGYLGTVLTTFAVIGMLLAMLLPAVSTARDRARSMQGLNNLRQIGICCVMYADAHDGQFPEDFKSLAPFASDSPDIFVSPSTGREPGAFESVDEWADYVLVPGRTRDDPPDTVLAFTLPECYPGEGGHVLTVDGSVLWRDIDQYEELTADFRSPGIGVRRGDGRETDEL